MKGLQLLVAAGLAVATVAAIDTLAEDSKVLNQITPRTGQTSGTGELRSLGRQPSGSIPRR